MELWSVLVAGWVLPECALWSVRYVWFPVCSAVAAAAGPGGGAVAGARRHPGVP